MESGPADAGNPVSKPDDQPKILGITEPLPEPVMSIIIVSNGEDDEEEVRTVSCSAVQDVSIGCHRCFSYTGVFTCLIYATNPVTSCFTKVFYQKLCSVSPQEATIYAK